MLPFPHFEAHVDPVILQRGKAYAEEEAVYDVYKSTNNTWKATVMGTELYEVQLVITKNTVSTWKCTCPYDKGPVCKHVVAVLYAIKDKNAGSEKVLQKNGSKAQTLESIINTLSTTQLKEALLYACRQYPQLRYELQAQFIKEDKIDKSTVCTSLKEALKRAQDRYSYIRYDKIPALKRTTSSFLDQAAASLQKGHYRNAIDILQALIETVVPTLETIDDSSGALSDIVEEAFSLLEILVTEELPSLLVDELLTYCLQAFKDKRYKGWDYKWYWPDLAIDLIRNPEEGNQLIELLDKELPSKQNTWADDFDAEQIARIKLTLFQKIQPEQVDSFIEKHLFFPSFREIAISTAFSNNDLPKAEALCLGGIREAENKHLPGLENLWYEWLLTIAQKQKNKQAIITTATYLLQRGQEERKYYNLLKSIQPDQEWTTLRQQYLNLLRQRHAIDTLMEIFIDEKDDKALERLLAQVGSLDYLILYEQPLLKQFPHIVKTLLPNFVYTYIEHNNSRPHYNKVANLLKNAKKKLNAEDIDTIVQTLQHLYPLRRALQDELKRV